MYYLIIVKMLLTCLVSFIWRVQKTLVDGHNWHSNATISNLFTLHAKSENDFQTNLQDWQHFHAWRRTYPPTFSWIRLGSFTRLRYNFYVLPTRRRIHLGDLYVLSNFWFHYFELKCFAELWIFQGLLNPGWFKKQFSPCWLGPR